MVVNLSENTISIGGRVQNYNYARKMTIDAPEQELVSRQKFNDFSMFLNLTTCFLFTIVIHFFAKHE